jgi:hypothetical protein
MGYQRDLPRAAFEFNGLEESRLTRKRAPY